MAAFIGLAPKYATLTFFLPLIYDQLKKVDNKLLPSEEITKEIEALKNQQNEIDLLDQKIKIMKNKIQALENDINKAKITKERKMVIVRGKQKMLIDLFEEQEEEKYGNQYNK